MSINKIIIIFALVLILLGGFVFFQFSNKAKMTTNGKVSLNAKTLDVEVVTSEKDKQIGLTKYQSITDNEGMLFVFEEPVIPNFWMKNMKFPIDMVFINGDTVVSIVENAKVPTDKNNFLLYKPEGVINYVLEINAGLVKKYNIHKGDRVKIEITPKTTTK